MVIENEENEELIFEGDVEEEVNKYELCLVGRFLTEKNINVRAMKTKMADVWKPVMSINIKEFKSGIYVFQFFRKEDMLWVFNGGPWSMLVISMVEPSSKFMAKRGSKFFNKFREKVKKQKEVLNALVNYVGETEVKLYFF